MAINVLQGSPGSGKSATAVAMAMFHLRRGGVVAANFGLVEGWASVLGSKTLAGRFCKELAHEKAVSFHKRFFTVNSLGAIKKLDPRGGSVWREETVEGKYQEGQGLLILDECQLVFNSRKWEKNFEWIEFFTQHRKLGWNVILIAHDIQMVDSQIRPLCEYETRYRNLQKVVVPVLGIPICPFPLFIAIKRYAGLGPGSTVVASRDVYPLPLWAARLYDSLHVFNSATWGENQEPAFCGSPPATLGGGGIVKQVWLERRSRLSGPHWDDHIQTITPQSV